METLFEVKHYIGVMLTHVSEEHIYVYSLYIFICFFCVYFADDYYILYVSIARIIVEIECVCLVLKQTNVSNSSVNVSIMAIARYD
jgi:hypothetical protein